MQRLLAVLTLFGGLACCAVAHATTFNLDISGSGDSVFGTGVITATSVSPTAYLITDLTGPDVTGFFQPGQFDNNDDLIYPASSDLLDSNGFAFSYLSDGTSYDANVYENSSGYFAYVVDEDGTIVPMVPVNVAISFVPTVTPEPSSFILLATGLLGIAIILRRRLSVNPGSARPIAS